MLSVSSSALWEPEAVEPVGYSRLVSSTVATLYPQPGVTFLVGHDRGQEAWSGPSGARGEWQSFAALVSHTIGKRGSASVHGQWLRDPAGVRAGGPRARLELGAGGGYRLSTRWYGSLAVTREVARGGVLPHDSRMHLAWRISYLFD
jgi:hypothetical protein